MSTTTKRLTVDQYEAMVENGILPETNRFELIEGRIVEKDMKGPVHRVTVGRTLRAIERLLPPGWHAVKEEAVRIPNQRSEPEPDVSIIRGSIDDYADHHPWAADIALVVEVTRTTAAKDRRLARVYGAGGIPAYWIVNIPRRQIEVNTDPDPAGGYRSRVDYRPGDDISVVIDGREVGRIPVADLLL